MCVCDMVGDMVGVVHVGACAVQLCNTRCVYKICIPKWRNKNICWPIHTCQATCKCTKYSLAVLSVLTLMV